MNSFHKILNENNETKYQFIVIIILIKSSPQNNNITNITQLCSFTVLKYLIQYIFSNDAVITNNG